MWFSFLLFYSWIHSIESFHSIHWPFQFLKFIPFVQFSSILLFLSVVVCWTLFYSFHSILFSVVPFCRSFLLLFVRSIRSIQFIFGCFDLCCYFLLIWFVLMFCCWIPSPYPWSSMCLYTGDKFLKPKAK